MREPVSLWRENEIAVINLLRVLARMVEVTLEKVYYGKLKFTIVNGTVSVTGIFQFTMVNFTLVNFHDYRGKNKDDPSPITIWAQLLEAWLALTSV